MELLEWEQESFLLELEDLMFATALTANSQVVDAEFERENFGHRALIHAHLYHEGKLWGVLQPCVFAQPRI